MSPALAAARVAIPVDDRFHLKDPTSSALGRRIVEQSIMMLDEMGLEAFTFRKLADRLGTTEASVYRYFRSKQRLLLYLVAWYWGWMEHRVRLATANVDDPVERLRRALRELTRPIERDDAVPEIDEVALYRVVVAESSKAYLNREVDADNREGLYRSYKRLCRGVAAIVSEIDPSYPYPVALVSTIVESSHMQRYFAEHLPSLTEVTQGPRGTSATEFLTDLAMRALGRVQASAARAPGRGRGSRA
jgi:AcrR family transcriptional regulator